MGAIPHISDPDQLLADSEEILKDVGPADTKSKKEKKEMPPKKVDIQRKQKRVMTIIDNPSVQEKLKKKVATKRAKKDSEKVTKAGGDDTRPLRATKKPKKETRGDSLPDTSTKTKSVRGRNAR